MRGGNFSKEVKRVQHLLKSGSSLVKDFLVLKFCFSRLHLRFATGIHFQRFFCHKHLSESCKSILVLDFVISVRRKPKLEVVKRNLLRRRTTAALRAFMFERKCNFLHCCFENSKFFLLDLFFLLSSSANEKSYLQIKLTIKGILDKIIGK